MAEHTDADVELVTRALADSAYGSPEDHAPWHYTEFGVICACGAPMRDEECLANWDHMPEDNKDNWRPDARAVLSALSARLLPPGGETGTEYNLRFRTGSGRWTVDDELTSYEPEDDWAHTRRLFGDDVHQVTRTVTTWPDGTALIGPWQPAEVASDG